MDWSPWSGLEGTAYLHWNVTKAASEGACELARVLQSLLDEPDLVHQTLSSARDLDLQSYVVLGWVGLVGPVARRSWDGGLARRSCEVVGLSSDVLGFSSEILVVSSEKLGLSCDSLGFGSGRLGFSSDVLG